MENKEESWTTVFILAAILLVVGVGALGFRWYKAGVQQEVYRRQGCEMSRWEVFMGARPIERYMQPEGK